MSFARDLEKPRRQWIMDHYPEHRAIQLEMLKVAPKVVITASPKREDCPTKIRGMNALIPLYYVVLPQVQLTFSLLALQVVLSVSVDILRARKYPTLPFEFVRC